MQLKGVWFLLQGPQFWTVRSLVVGLGEASPPSPVVATMLELHRKWYSSTDASVGEQKGSLRRRLNAQFWG